MRSMTGHGRGKAVESQRQRHVVVELSTVNRKQFELACSLPRGCADLEPKVRELVVPVVQRGRLNCSISFESAPTRKQSRVIDLEAAKAYQAELEGLRKKLRLTSEVTLEQILQGPGVIRDQPQEENQEELWTAIEKALKLALKQLLKMRLTEGRHLAEEFGRILTGMESAVAKIQTLAPESVARHRAALLSRLSEAGLPLAAEDERLHKEIVFFADRSDITEELTRLASHFVQFRQMIRENNAVGRSLEFLTQEMNREINTIGSKANDLEITRLVMMLKAELEKIREQIQNVE